jgi:2-hydroxychromene-2-carboxylate isomerase
MSKQVEFYFDFGSPNAYLAYTQLPALAARCGAGIVWQPMLLGGVFQATGNRSPAEVPAKSRWSRTDIQRWVRRYGIEFRHNPHFPVNTLALMRGAVGVQLRGEEDAFRRYVDAMFRAMWVEERNLAEPVEVAHAVKAAGLDPEEVQAMIADPEVKTALKERTERAVERGVFGAPTFFVDDELFFGQDRMHFVEEALTG